MGNATDGPPVERLIQEAQVEGMEAQIDSLIRSLEHQEWRMNVLKEDHAALKENHAIQLGGVKAQAAERIWKLEQENNQLRVDRVDLARENTELMGDLKIARDYVVLKDRANMELLADLHSTALDYVDLLDLKAQPRTPHQLKLLRDAHELEFRKVTLEELKDVVSLARVGDREGFNILAIQLLREGMDASLKPAKEFVDAERAWVPGVTDRAGKYR